MTSVNCPSCSTPVEMTKESKFRPFCSERCRMLDLADWASEGHKIPGEHVLQDEWSEESVIAPNGE